MSVISVYAIFASAEEAERIGRTVVQERLAACINIFGPIRSVYRWQGEVETADEIAAILKTTHNSANALIADCRPAQLRSAVHCLLADRERAERCADWIESTVG